MQNDPEADPDPKLFEELANKGYTPVRESLAVESAKGKEIFNVYSRGGKRYRGGGKGGGTRRTANRPRPLHPQARSIAVEDIKDDDGWIPAPDDGTCTVEMDSSDGNRTVSCPVSVTRGTWVKMKKWPLRDWKEWTNYVDEIGRDDEEDEEDEDDDEALIFDHTPGSEEFTVAEGAYGEFTVGDQVVFKDYHVLKGVVTACIDGYVRVKFDEDPDHRTDPGGTESDCKPY